MGYGSLKMPVRLMAPNINSTENGVEQAVLVMPQRSVFIPPRISARSAKVEQLSRTTLMLPQRFEHCATMDKVSATFISRLMGAMLVWMRSNVPSWISSSSDWMAGTTIDVRQLSG